MTIAVTNTADSGPNSLRAAIQQVNADSADSATSPDVINFEIPTRDPNFNPTTNTWTISPASQLDPIANPVIINGFSQPGAMPNSNSPVQGNNAVLKIVLNGSLAGPNADGLLINAGSSAVLGLVIDSFQANGIEIAGAGDFVQGDTIGLDPSGTNIMGNLGDGILSDGPNTQIGGNIAGAANIISGNAGNGIELTKGAAGSSIDRNYIGTDSTGTMERANAGNGILTQAGDPGTGGIVKGIGTFVEFNLVSGNLSDGVDIESGAGPVQIESNDIGTDLSGDNNLGNSGDGVLTHGVNTTIGVPAVAFSNIISFNHVHGIEVGSDASALIQNNLITISGADGVTTSAPGTTIGGSAANAGNAIFGNGGDGINLTQSASGSAIQGNFIGIDKNGGGFGNTGDGILTDAPNSTIGGTASSTAGNVISGNFTDGINIGADATSVVIQGNTIGLKPDGETDDANSADGIRSSASGTMIGGTDPLARNIISGNGGNGINLLLGAMNVTIQGNIIGLDKTGTKRSGSIGNGGNGILDNATMTTIGASVPGARNIISGNLDAGINFGHDSSSNVVQGNYIGTDITGMVLLGNQGDGIEDDAPNTTIGGIDPGATTLVSPDAGNLISGNAGNGINLLPQASNNLIEGNIIGLDKTGRVDLANSGDGVRTDAAGTTIGPTPNMIGVMGSGNLISGNAANGINVLLDASITVIVGNFIGTDITGTTSTGFIANSADGILTDSNPGTTGIKGTTIGGTTPGSRNLISGNEGDGVGFGVDSTNGLVEGNIIGLDVTGQQFLSNDGAGVRITGDNVTVGGTTDMVRNIISGNIGAGVSIESSSDNDTVLGNFIGTDISGLQGFGNAGDGVLIFGCYNVIGGTDPLDRNIISSNGGDGINLGLDAMGNSVQNNYIGTDKTGTIAVSNTHNGVLLTSATGNFIGTPGAGNLISGNGNNGVEITGLSGDPSTGNTVQGNFIGSDFTGTTFTGADGFDLGNFFDGVNLTNLAQNNLIGGLEPGDTNLISGNDEDGVRIIGALATGNQLIGNVIGLNASGRDGLGNGGNGVTITDVNGGVPGPVTLVARNSVSSNVGAGLAITGTATSTLVQNNFFGTDATGTTSTGPGPNNFDLGNNIGIFIDDAVGNIIGGDSIAVRNIISGNDSIGVLVSRISPAPSDPNALDSNTIEHNFIGTDFTGTQPLGNGNGTDTGLGVFLNNTRNEVILDNVISANTQAGVEITGNGGPNSPNNLIVGNTIGAAFDGTLLQMTDPVSSSNNGLQSIGVLVISSTGNLIGGSGVLANTISDNTAGVEITGSTTTVPTNPLAGGVVTNQVTGNLINRNLIGIFLNQTNENVISSNTLTANISTGVTLLGTLTTNNAIVNNQIVKNFDQPTHPTNGTGVYIEQGVGNTIQDNTISQNGLVGVYLFNVIPINQAANNLVQRNRITNNKQYGIFLYNSGGNVPGVIMSGPNANQLSGNTIANFREFTGTVLPRIGSTRKSSKSLKVTVHTR